LKDGASSVESEHTIMSKIKRNWLPLALIFLLLGTLGTVVAYRSSLLQVAHVPIATHVPTSPIGPLPTTQSNNGRISYPWPMELHKNPTTGSTYWLPTNARVYQELETDFLAYWDWSGHAGPASFPFTPDPNQIPILATPGFQGQLQAYINQLHTQEQVTAYLGSQRQTPQAIRACTQDGLECQVYYSFLAVTKTTYHTQTGKTLSQTKPITLILLITQSYSKEAQRWQLSHIVSQELAG
jgi:hypothetical protein